MKIGSDIPGKEINLHSWDTPLFTFLTFSLSLAVSGSILQTVIILNSENNILIKQYAYRKLASISSNQPVTIYLSIYI